MLLTPISWNWLCPSFVLFCWNFTLSNDQNLFHDVPDFPNNQKTVRKINNLRRSKFPKKRGGGQGRYDYNHIFNCNFFKPSLRVFFFNLTISQIVAIIINSRSQIITTNSSKNKEKKLNHVLWYIWAGTVTYPNNQWFVLSLSFLT